MMWALYVSISPASHTLSTSFHPLITETCTITLPHLTNIVYSVPVLIPHFLFQVFTLKQKLLNKTHLPPLSLRQRPHPRGRVVLPLGPHLGPGGAVGVGKAEEVIAPSGAGCLEWKAYWTVREKSRVSL